jgi:hypothetical protein
MFFKSKLAGFFRVHDTARKTDKINSFGFIDVGLEFGLNIAEIKNRKDAKPQRIISAPSRLCG